MLLTFYRGVEVEIWSTNVDLLHHQNQAITAPNRTQPSQLLLGSLLAVFSCLSYALWLILQVTSCELESPSWPFSSTRYITFDFDCGQLQTKMGETYPCQYTSTALITSMASIQAVGFALCTERDWTQWKLGWNVRLLAVAYTVSFRNLMIDYQSRRANIEAETLKLFQSSDFLKL